MRGEGTLASPWKEGAGTHGSRTWATQASPTGRPSFPSKNLPSKTLLANDSSGGNGGCGPERATTRDRPYHGRTGRSSASEHGRGDPLWSPCWGQSRRVALLLSFANKVFHREVFYHDAWEAPSYP